jgi:hypothetical protein
MYKTKRSLSLAKKIVFIDGLEGCGKTLFSTIISSLDRVEKLTYAYELEMFCSLYHINKIEKDAVLTLTRMLTDLVTYDSMMSREVNFRPTDLSSIFKSPFYFKYLKRMFLKGDAAVPERIDKENPITALTVHKLLINALPIFEALKDRVRYVEVVRHPLYMLIQQTINNETLIYTPRDFVIYVEYNNTEIPWYAIGWEEIFLNSKPIDKTIYYIYELNKLMNKNKDEINTKYPNQLITIPFEKFVLDPMPFMHEISTLISSKIVKETIKCLKNQNVPRTKIADGIPLEVYKRCGWVPSNENMTEKEELNLRRKYAIKQGVSDKALALLDEMSLEYENKYMKGIL